MRLDIDNRQKEIELSAKLCENIEKIIEETLLSEKGSTDYEISLSFVDNKEIKDLNAEYRNIPRETDVLSFPVGEDFPLPIPILGDIIISGEKALEQSEEYGHSVNREILYLVVHSVFHLLGYNHIDKEEEKIMRRKEKQIMGPWEEL